MLEISHLLAETDPPWGKFLGVGIVVLIWIIGILAQTAKKQSEKAEKRRAPELDEEIRKRLPPATPGPSRDPRERIVQRPDWEVIAQHPEPPPQRTAAKPKQRRTPRAPARPVPPPVPVKQPPFAQAEPIADAFPQAQKVVLPGDVVKPAPAFVGAKAIRGWMKPATLQQQYILTELFQPPLSMRNPDRQP